MKILPQMYMGTRKSWLNLGSHPDTQSGYALQIRTPDTDSGYGLQILTPDTHSGYALGIRTPDPDSGSGPDLFVGGLRSQSVFY